MENEEWQNTTKAGERTQHANSDSTNDTKDKDRRGSEELCYFIRPKILTNDVADVTTLIFLLLQKIPLSARRRNENHQI